MPRKKSQPKRLAIGIYSDRYGIRATVRVRSRDSNRSRWKRFPSDTPIREIKEWQQATRVELTRSQRRPTVAAPGTLGADARRYLAQLRHLASYKPRVCEVDACTALYGRLRRIQVTAEHVRKARAAWVAEGYKPKTINNRVQTLRHFYRILDGKHSPTPANEVEPLVVPSLTPTLVPAEVFRTVAANLTDPKTCARFKVIASTGVRPAELKGTEPGDIDVDRRVWAVRTAKGGTPLVFWLNDDMVAAWQAFI